MMVTVETCYIYNVKTITRQTNIIPNTKDKWVGDFNCPSGKSAAKYFKEQFKL